MAHTWTSNTDKFEVIGYLAAPNRIASIEAVVPQKPESVNKFKKEFANMYSENFPYTANKYGRQFRIYLNDTEGCPNSLKKLLDSQYGNRINDTAFIEEIVKQYGFRFTHEPQNSSYIKKCVAEKVDKKLYVAFLKGFYSSIDYLKKINDNVNGDIVPEPNILKYSKKTISKRSDGTASHVITPREPLPRNQMLLLGWDGEAYISKLLETHNEGFLKELGLTKNTAYSYEWFNAGYEGNIEVEEVIIDDQPRKKMILNWIDQSVGKGCDIRVMLDSGIQIDIEVKTSLGKYPYFTMSSVEMQEMESMGDDYYLVRITEFKRLNRGESPNIIVIKNPYKKLFHTNQMHEATFIIGEK